MFYRSILLSLTTLAVSAPAFADCAVFEARLASAKKEVAFSDLMAKQGQTLRDRRFYTDDVLLPPFDMCRIYDEVVRNDKISTKYHCTYIQNEPAGGNVVAINKDSQAEFVAGMLPKFLEVETCILALKDQEGMSYAHGSLYQTGVNALFSNDTQYDGADDVSIELSAMNVGFGSIYPRIKMIFEIRTGARVRDENH